MESKQNYQIEKNLAKAIQKALIAHQVDPEKIQETMTFLGVVLGGMIGSLYPESEHDEKIFEILESTKEGILKGLPE